MTEAIAKLNKSVTPAKAGVQKFLKRLDSRFRGNDNLGLLQLAMTERNIVLIGAGYWGKNLIRNFHQLGVLKTICDQSSAIRQQMAKDYPDTRE